MSLPTIPCQNRPINFDSAISAKDAAHARSKLDHDKSKLSLPRLSPGQEVYLQDSKSSAWDKRAIIVSMRPDNLSYIIKSDNRHFTRPRRLLRPVPSATPLLSDLSSSSHPEPVPLRRSSRLQGLAPSAVVHHSDSTSPTSPNSLSSSWLLSSHMVNLSSTSTINSDSSRSTSRSVVSPLTVALPPSTPKTRPQFPSNPMSPTRPIIFPSTSRTTASV